MLVFMAYHNLFETGRVNFFLPQGGSLTGHNDWSDLIALHWVVLCHDSNPQ